MRLLPSDLLDIPKNVRFALDTETSGLHPDSGARVSTVSVAWLDAGLWGGIGDKPSQEEWPSGITTVGEWFEFEGQTVRIVSCAWPFDQGVDGTGKSEDRGNVGLWEDTINLGQSEWDALLEVIAGRKLDMANAKFDCMLMNAGVRSLANTIDLHTDVAWDVMAGFSLLYPQYSNALKGKGSATFAKWGADSTEEQDTIKKYLLKHKLPKGRWDLMPWSIIAKYADMDARLTYREGMDQREMLRGDSERTALFQRRMEVMRMLYRVEQRGLPYDKKQSRGVAEVLKARVNKQADLLPFAPTTINAAKKFWFEELGLTPYEMTKKGAPSVDASAVDRMIEDKIPGAAAWAEVQKGQNADSKWYSGYPDLCGPDGRLRGSLRQFGTVSLRFSIERAQLQAIPQDYRLNRAILEGLPSPRRLIRDGVPAGLKLWDLDLANAELRIAALYAKSKPMLDLINTGADAHGATATALFGSSPGDPGWDLDRMVAKRSNFSLIFGVGWETFQETLAKQADVKISEKEARRIVREWNRLYPEFSRAIKYHQERVESRQRRNREVKGLGWVAAYNGERRWYGKDRKKPNQQEETHSAFNQRVQTSLGQFAIEWWLSVEREAEMRFPDPGLGLVMMVHDSADVLVPDDGYGEMFIEWCQEEGVRIWERTFPGVPGGVDAAGYGE